MSSLAASTPYPIEEKHDRSFSAGRHETPRATSRAEQHLLDGLPDPAALEGLALPWWRLLPAATRGMLAVWAARARSRRALARVDGHTLRDAGIDPGAARFEVNQPFWREPLALRDIHGVD